MEQKHKWAKEIIAWLNREKVQCSAVVSDNWFVITRPDYPLSNFDNNGYKFRIAPKTININGHEIPEPLRETPKELVKYYVPHIGLLEKHYKYEWLSSEDDFNRLKQGFVHLTKEAAIAHAEALLSFTQSEDEQ